MKIYILLLVQLLPICLLAQQSFFIRVGASTQVSANDANVNLVLTNTKFENLGTFQASEGRAIIRGNSDSNLSAIGGTGTTSFANLEIDKTENEVRLAGDIEVNQGLLMTSNNLNLGSHNLFLSDGDSGEIVGESAASCIYSAQGGEIIKTVTLNAPNGQNPAGLGLVFTSNDNLGTTTIRRGHEVDPTKEGMLVERYYDINASNTNTTTDLEFHYLEGELGDLNEENLVLWQEENYTEWTRKDISAQDMTNNSVSIQNVSSTGVVTLGSDALFVSTKIALPSIYDANTNLMVANLSDILPSNEPYSALGHSDLQNAGTDADFSSTNPDAIIVDWVLVELRDPATPSNILATRAALLQRDGSIVDVDGKSPVPFEGLSEGNYHIAIRHRNHLGTMTASPVMLAY